MEQRLVVLNLFRGLLLRKSQTDARNTKDATTKHPAQLSPATFPTEIKGTSCRMIMGLKSTGHGIKSIRHRYVLHNPLKPCGRTLC